MRLPVDGSGNTLPPSPPPASRSLLHSPPVLLAELSERASEAEVRATYPEAEGAHEGRVGELSSAADEAKENVNQLNDELR